MTGKTIYRGEGLVKRWGDSSSALRTVTIQLQEDDPLSRHPFFGFDGRRVAIVVVELAEAESGPLPALDKGPGEGGAANTGANAAPPSKPNSTRAVMMAKDPEFQLFCEVASEAEAEAEIKAYCRIQSKTELNDKDGLASALFNGLRGKFADWKRNR